MVPLCNEARYFFSIIIGNNSDLMPTECQSGITQGASSKRDLFPFSGDGGNSQFCLCWSHLYGEPSLHLAERSMKRLRSQELSNTITGPNQTWKTKTIPLLSFYAFLFVIWLVCTTFKLKANKATFCLLLTKVISEKQCPFTESITPNYWVVSKGVYFGANGSFHCSRCSYIKHLPQLRVSTSR